MKKTAIFILLLLFATYYANAQTGKTKFMTITIAEINGTVSGTPLPNMIVTRTDSVQDQKYVNFSSATKAKNPLAAHEALMMLVFKPYFDNGWKLIAATVENPITQGNTYVENYRYYFSKDSQ
jgi:hypothetical protein